MGVYQSEDLLQRKDEILRSRKIKLDDLRRHKATERGWNRIERVEKALRRSGLEQEMRIAGKKEQ